MSIFDECRGISCVDAAVMLGIKLSKNTSHSAWALCPMHGERGHPSLFLSSHRGWYCYGCHKGGDAVKLYQEYLGLEPLEAARQCAADFGRSMDDDYEPSVHVGPRHLVNALHRRRDKVLVRLANEICDADDAIQRMIHSDGPEYCAESSDFMALVACRADKQLQLDRLSEADEMELLELLKEYEGGKHED